MGGCDSAAIVKATHTGQRSELVPCKHGEKMAALQSG